MEYLSVEDLIKLNATQIEMFSPGEMVGVKDSSALDAAANQPKQIVFGEELYPSIEEKGAILIINLIKKHPFHNANKRTGFFALDIFMGLNDSPILFEIDEMVEFSVRIATHDARDFDALKEWVTIEIKNHLS